MADVLTQSEPAPESVRAPLIELAGVEKVYRTGRVEYPALRGVDLSIVSGDMVAIVGPSGSGKSTIMNIITGIAFVFPIAYPAITLVGTAILAVLVMLAPLRRAVHFEPGDALRCA
jgi:ABC-type Fe3+/spermidine/putrescine transport system ATPase subunit